MNLLCGRYDYAAYLEIGCRHDECFANVHAAVKVGVDPEWGGTHRMTSDEYFAQTTDRFDVIFIDGLHLSEQVRVDLANARAHLNRKGVIVLHDCLPDNEHHADAQRARDMIASGDPNLHGIGEWCGDVWTVLVEARNDRELDVALWPGDHGCGLVIERESHQTLPWHPVDLREYLTYWPAHIVGISSERDLEQWLAIS
jgi:hypothetical protein